MQGLHLTADLHLCRCDTRWLTDAQWLGQHCTAAVQRVGLQAVAELFHTFPATPRGPGGVTARCPLRGIPICACTPGPSSAVSHSTSMSAILRVTTRREAEALMADLIQLFQPERLEMQRLQRGEIAEARSV